MRYVVFTFDEHAPPRMNCGAWARRPEIRGDFERSAEAVDAWCRQRYHLGITRISCGDTLDSFEPDPDRLDWLKTYFRQHLEYCRAYHYIQGQHDRVMRCPTTPWLSLLTDNPKMQYSHRKVVKIADRAFCFHDNASQTELYQGLREILPKEPTILVAHQLWHPWLPSGRMLPSFLDLPESVRMVFSGDYHVQRDDQFVCHDGHALRAWSGGPLTVQEISSDPACRFLVLDLETMVVESVPLPYRPILRHHLETEEQLLQFLQEVSRLKLHPDPFSVEIPILQVKYMSNLPDAYRQIRDASQGRAHLFCDPLVAVQEGSFHTIYSRSIKHDITSAIEASGKAPIGSLERKIVDISLEVSSPSDLELKLDALQKSYLEEQDANRETSVAELLSVPTAGD